MSLNLNCNFYLHIQYIDVALPYFEIVNKEDETDKIKIKVYRKDRKSVV